MLFAVCMIFNRSNHYLFNNNLMMMWVKRKTWKEKKRKNISLISSPKTTTLSNEIRQSGKNEKKQFSRFSFQINNNKEKDTHRITRLHDWLPYKINQSISSINWLIFCMFVCAKTFVVVVVHKWWKQSVNNHQKRMWKKFSN